MSKKTSFFLFSAAHRGGFMFTETSEQREQLVSGGEWFEHPDAVPAQSAEGAGNATQYEGAQTFTNNATAAPGDPHFTLAEILHSSVSLFSIAQLAGEAMKHNLVLATVGEDGALALVKGEDEPAPAPTPQVKRETAVAYDNEAVAAMILSGNTDPLQHSHFVALAKALDVKTHKVKQADLIANLKATLQSGTPPQRPAGEAVDGDEEENEEEDDEIVLGADGKPVPPLKPNTD